MYSYLELENKSFEDFYLKFCGMQECKPNYSYGPAVRPNYLLHYCLSGQGEYHVNNQVYQIKAGDAFLIKPFASLVVFPVVKNSTHTEKFFCQVAARAKALGFDVLLF